MDHDRRERWIRRTTASFALRMVVLLGPLTASLAFAWTATRATDVPDTGLLVVVRWVVIAACSTVVLIVAERQLRRLLPLVALLRLSLSFPDRAPSRVRIALRTGSTRQLQQRIEDARAGRLGATAGESAVRVLELVAALNLHDPLTRGHSERVRAYAQMIGREMDLSEHDLDRLMWAALLHDIGKLLVPTEILNKPGRLTDEEFDVIKLHPEYGKALVEPLTPWLGDAARAVWEHHERWSGGGYPRGITSDEISLPARVVSVADTFDVITSVRSYKSRTSPKAARAELARCAGTQFDPAVVRAFMNASTHQFGWLSGPAGWLAQTTLLPPTAVAAVVRSGWIASGLTIGGLTLASGASATDAPSDNSLRRIDDIELGVDVDAGTPDAVAGARTPRGSTGLTGGVAIGPGAAFDPSPDASPPGTPTGEPTPGDPTPGDPTAGDPTTTTTTAVPSDDGPTAGPTVPTTVPPTTAPTTVPTDQPPVTLPGDPVPPVTIPGSSIPPITTPGVSIPGVSIPNVTIPNVTIPDVSVPNVTIPDVTIPPATIPPVTVPPVTVPPVTLAPPTLPPVTVPPATTPTVTLPGLIGS